MSYRIRRKYINNIKKEVKCLIRQKTQRGVKIVFKVNKHFSFLIAFLIAINPFLSSITYAEDNEGTSYVLGSVEPTIVSFQVPMEASFAINPNEENGFVASDINIKNLSTAPLDVGVKSFKYVGGLLNEPVKTTDYTNEQWKDMSVTDSVTKVSLSLAKKTLSSWDLYSGEVYEASDDEEANMKNMGVLLPSQETTLSISGKHGRAFSTTITSKYRITFVFGLSDYTSLPTDINTPTTESTNTPTNAPTNTPTNTPIQDYEVTFNSQGGSDVSAITAQQNTLIEVPTDPTKTGYAFAGWYKETELSNAWAFDTDTVASNTILYAKWIINSYTVTFDSQGGSEIDPANVEYNSEIIPPVAPTKEGHTFAGWYKEAELTNAWTFVTDKVTANTTLYAKWTINSYTLNFDSQGGSAVSSVSVVHNTVATAPTAPTKTGYTFVGWYKEVGLINTWAFATDKIIANTTLYAKWTINNYTVIFDSQGGSAVNNINTYYESMITAPIMPTKTGYTFAGWYKESSITNPWIFGNDRVVSDMTLYAKWTINTYKITFDSQGGNNVNSVYTIYNTIATVPETPTKTGYTFAGWYKEVGLITQWVFATDKVTTNTTLYAKWTINNYTVSFDSQGGNSISPSSIVYNTTVTAPVDPTKEGYTFAGWYKEVNLITPWVFTTDTVILNTTLYAKWTINEYTVTFNSQNDVSMNNITNVTYNTNIIAPIDPTKTGYTFAGWYKDEFFVNQWAFNVDTVTSNTILYAKWIINSYTLTFDSNGGSFIDSSNVSYNTIVTAPTVPVKTGYTFAGWYKDTSLTTPWIFTTDKITTDVTLYASWLINTYYIVFDSQGGSNVASTSTIYNTAITEPVSPTREYYEFGGWYKELDYINKVDFNNNLITENTTLYAKWISTGINWTSQYVDDVLTGVVPIYSVAYGNGIFVTTGVMAGAGKLLISSDGINWETITLGTTNTWRSVTYGDGLFVAVADTGTGNRVMTSLDGINWTARISAADNSWKSVTYGNGLFVAVADTGTGNRVMTSADGINWAVRESAADNSWKSVTYGNGLFVAVASSGTGNRVMTSADGINWAVRESAADNAWSSITYGNGLFVAVSSSGTGNRVMTSINGIIWTARISPQDNWLSVSYGNGIFVAVAYSGVGTKIMTSTSIQNNYVVTYDTQGGTSIQQSIVTFNSVLNESSKPIKEGYDFVGWYKDSLYSYPWNYSTDKITQDTILYAKWQPQSSLPGEVWNVGSLSVSYNSVVYGNDKFVAVGINGLAYSYNGKDWLQSSNYPSNTWRSVTYGNGLFVAVASSGTGNRVMTSSDGINWTARTSSIDNNWVSVTYGSGLFVAVSSSGSYNRVMTSPDGINWTTRTYSLADAVWSSVTYGNGLFVAVSSGPTNNIIMTSPDGITWTTRISTVDNVWNSVTYGNGLFVAVSSSGTGNRVMTSSNGINWTARTSAADNTWNSVTYGNGLFVAVSSSGTENRVMTSLDGINWTSRNTINNTWNSVTYGNGLFVAISTSGINNKVMTSGLQ